MKDSLNKFYAFLERPLFPKSRILLAGLSISLAMAFASPLWRISMEAPQYPKGLTLDIYAYKLEGGNDGNDIREINTLNHYIGMHALDRAALNDLDWLPFALGAMVLLALRVAAIGNVSSLIDLVVVSGYVSCFAFARFIYKLWVFGHDLDPKAPLTVEPFMPVVLGTKQIANFSTHSMPLAGSAFLGLFVVGIVGIALWHLIAGRLAAVKAERLAGVATVAMLALAAGVQGCGMDMHDHAGAGEAGIVHHTRECLCDDGGAHVAWRCHDDADVVRGQNTLVFQVHDTASTAMEGAAVTVEPWMPAHAHGAPSEPVTTELGNGVYRVDNVVFSMGGEWQLKVHVTKGDVHDHATFAVDVP